MLECPPPKRTGKGESAGARKGKNPIVTKAARKMGIVPEQRKEPQYDSDDSGSGEDIIPQAAPSDSGSSGTESSESNKSKKKENKRVEQPKNVKNKANKDKKGPPPVRLNTKQEEKVVDYVEDHPILFDIYNDEFKLTDKKNRIWSNIGAKVGKTGEEARRWWETNRDRFNRMHKKYKKSGSPGQLKTTKQQWIWRRFQFYSNYAYHHNTESLVPIRGRENRQSSSSDDSDDDDSGAGAVGQGVDDGGAGDAGGDAGGDAVVVVGGGRSSGGGPKVPGQTDLKMKVVEKSKTVLLPSQKKRKRKGNEQDLMKQLKEFFEESNKQQAELLKEESAQEGYANYVGSWIRGLTFEQYQRARVHVNDLISQFDSEVCSPDEASSSASESASASNILSSAATRAGIPKMELEDISEGDEEQELPDIKKITRQRGPRASTSSSSSQFGFSGSSATSSNLWQSNPNQWKATPDANNPLYWSQSTEYIDHYSNYPNTPYGQNVAPNVQGYLGPGQQGSQGPQGPQGQVSSGYNTPHPQSGSFAGQGNYGGQGNFGGQGGQGGQGNFAGQGNFGMQGQGNYVGQGNYQMQGNMQGNMGQFTGIDNSNQYQQQQGQGQQQLAQQVTQQVTQQVPQQVRPQAPQQVPQQMQQQVPQQKLAKMPKPGQLPPPPPGAEGLSVKKVVTAPKRPKPSSEDQQPLMIPELHEKKTPKKTKKTDKQPSRSPSPAPSLNTPRPELTPPKAGLSSAGNAAAATAPAPDAASDPASEEDEVRQSVEVLKSVIEETVKDIDTNGKDEEDVSQDSKDSKEAKESKEVKESKEPSGSKRRKKQS